MSQEPLVSELADDPDMAPLIVDFIRDLAETSQRLKTHLETGDLAEIRRIGHQMKGAGAGYGYPLLTDVGGALERAVDADGGLTLNVRQQAQVFLEYCQRAVLGAAIPN